MFLFSKVEIRKTRLKLDKLFEGTTLCSENCEWGAIVSLFRLFFFHLKISKRMKLFFAPCVKFTPWTCFQLPDIFDIFDICEILKNPNLWSFWTVWKKTHYQTFMIPPVFFIATAFTLLHFLYQIFSKLKSAIILKEASHV